MRDNCHQINHARHKNHGRPPPSSLLGVTPSSSATRLSTSPSTTSTSTSIRRVTPNGQRQPSYQQSPSIQIVTRELDTTQFTSPMATQILRHKDKSHGRKKRSYKSKFHEPNFNTQKPNTQMTPMTPITQVPFLNMTSAQRLERVRKFTPARRSFATVTPTQIFTPKPLVYVFLQGTPSYV